MTSKKAHLCLAGVQLFALASASSQSMRVSIQIKKKLKTINLSDYFATRHKWARTYRVHDEKRISELKKWIIFLSLSSEAGRRYKTILIFGSFDLHINMSFEVLHRHHFVEDAVN